MQVNVLLFGIARDIAGTSMVQVELSDDTSVRQLQDQLMIKYPEMQQVKSLMVAVNQQYATAEQIISDNDEVAVIPPVSGG